MSIYEEIKKKKGYISALAPMEGITDSSFRQILSEIGKPDLFFTEFLSVEGFCSKGRDSVSHRLKFSPKERPVVVQLWGNVPEYYEETVKNIKKLKPDGIDINIGCSVRDVLSGGRGSGLINHPELVKEIIESVRREAKGIPVSVKTRLGYERVDVDGWIGFLLKQDLDLITIHCRTSKEGYGTASQWEYMKECIELRNRLSPNTMIIGNGDLKSIKEGEKKIEEYGIDGFMIGRGILNNPWLFSDREDISKEERIQILVKHLEIFERTWKNKKPFYSQKKYIKAYISNFDGANELRKGLMGCISTEEVKSILKKLQP
jgi:tRNA-dihydrouridine synthase